MRRFSFFANLSHLSGFFQVAVDVRIRGWAVDVKRVYRIYKAEGLEVRTQRRKKRAAMSRVPLPCTEGRSQRLSMGFLADKLVDRRRFRVLTVVDNFDRSCPELYADRSIGAEKIIAALENATRKAGSLPQANFTYDMWIVADTRTLKANA